MKPLSQTRRSHLAPRRNPKPQRQGDDRCTGCNCRIPEGGLVGTNMCPDCCKTIMQKGFDAK